MAMTRRFSILAWSLTFAVLFAGIWLVNTLMIRGDRLLREPTVISEARGYDYTANFRPDVEYHEYLDMSAGGLMRTVVNSSGGWAYLLYPDGRIFVEGLTADRKEVRQLPNEVLDLVKRGHQAIEKYREAGKAVTANKHVSVS